ncbi:MAG: leucine-rich repeat protein, partial [Clostridia bacterium]|nr:leucine-rich repeat protein [Clostridia bacterium]
MKKKLLVIMLAIAMVMTFIPVLAMTSSAAEVASGTSGDVNWALTDDGTLTFSGEGAMADHSNGSQPWYAYKDSIKTVIVTKGVTSISTNAFREFSELATVKIAGSVTAIGDHAFYSYTKLSTVEYYGSSNPTAGSTAFFGIYGVVKVPSSYSEDVFCGKTVQVTLDAANEPLPPCDHAGHTQTGCTACGATDESIHSFVNGFCTECDAFQPAVYNEEKGYYEIDNAGKLFWFAAEVNGGNTEINGKLMTDIDLENRPWTPIGNSSNRYNGIFDGNGKTIKGLYFYDENAEGVGLFGYIGTNGQVKAVTLTNSSITGRNSFGGIAGHNRGIITGCVNNAVVSGDYSSVGGIAGMNYGTVELCGNTGKITTATSEAGGIVGRNNGTIRNCYNTGDVYAERIDAGGIVGLNNGGTAEYCWSTGNAAAGSDYEGGIAGKNDGALLYCYSAEEPIGSYGSNGTYSYVGTRTAEQFQSGEVAYLLGSAWGQTLGTNATPVFATDANKVYQSFACDGTTPLYTNDASLEGKAAPHTFGANSNGFCTECNVEGVYQPAVYNEERGYYEISNAGQLFWFAGLVNGTLTDGTAQNASANAILTADIDLNPDYTFEADGTVTKGGIIVTEGWRDWTPIGSSTTPYAGAFRGVQHRISHVYINSTDDYQGLFGYVTGTVNGCTVRDSYVKGKDYVGGVIGYLKSTGEILFCENLSSVNGEMYVGGVIGYADSASLINECANEGKVVGTEYVGGVIGYASYGVETIVNCENSGFISGEDYVGGLLGWGGATIENCTNTGDISGARYVGGVVGNNYNTSNILNCANRGTVAGTSSVGGVAGSSGNIENSYNLGIVKGVASAEAQAQGTNDSEDVGGIVGDGRRTVSKCYNDGPVAGYKNVGGIVGYNSGTVNQCHNIKTVEGMDSVGGIVGYNDGTVQYCFNQGNVPSVYVNQEGVETRIPFSGAVVGQKDWYGSTELNCYYLISDTVNASVGGINGKDSAGKAEAKTAEQFASGELTWKLNLGISDGTQAWYQTLSDSENVKLPTLVPEKGLGATILNAVYRSAPCGISYSNESGVVIEHTYVNGICTACDSFMQPTQNAEGYYEIDNAGKLYWFAAYVNSKVQIAGADTPDDTTDDVYSNSANAILTANITVNENVLSDTYELNEGTFREWTPIGKQSNIRFEGIFDGQGYTVSGLYAYFENIATSVTGATLPQGMFGMLDDYAVVKNLTLADTYFYAEYGEMGAIVGWNTGTVENCFAEALLVSRSNMLGGIVGENYGSVKGCTFAGVLKSVSNIGSALGGIVGHNAYGGKVQNCINLGDILGRNQVGGIVGSLGTNSGVVENCYNAGSLSGEKIKNYDLIIGQVIGDPKTYASQVINCYYLADSESDTIYGTTAKTAAQFASGEVAYLLGDAFGQSLGENGDEYPVFANDASKVYMLANCDGTPYIYTNDAAQTITEHQAGVSAAECFDENGVCLTCGTQAAARLTTADETPVVTYYMTLAEAITAAESAENSTVTLLDDVQLSETLKISAGKFTIDLNGKTISGAANGDFSNVYLEYRCLIFIEKNVEITIDDSTAEKNGTITFDDANCTILTYNKLTVKNGNIKHTAGGTVIYASYWSSSSDGSKSVAYLVVENGTFMGSVFSYYNSCEIRGGSFEWLYLHNANAPSNGNRLMGGSFDKISIASNITWADAIAEDYYFYDANGKVITPADETELTNVTVKKGADLSKDAVITVSDSEYNGVAQIPTVIVTVGGVTLDYGEDYSTI